jgi:twitching motility two-component system response regulator PilH
LARKILLADDSVTAQNMGRRILTDAGYEVTTVNNGSAALKKIAESLPELIVLDVYMPGYSGLEVCQRLKETRETARIPVLLTVGKLEPFKPEEARRARADAFIVKPFEASELLTALTKLEDKIVPQPAGKSGQFAKVWADLERDEGDGKSEKFGNAETGWKNRLSIPSGSKKDEPAVEEEASGKSSKGKKEKGKEKKKDEELKPLEVKAPVEATSAAGVPADITPEEVAAIAAAAAAFEEKNQPAAEFSVKKSEIPEEPATVAAEVVQPEVDAKAEQAKEPEAVKEVSVATEETKAEPATETKTPEPVSATKETVADAVAEAKEACAETTPMPEPAALPAVPKWVAQEVEIPAAESAINLEQEMEKATSVLQAAMAQVDFSTSANVETPPPTPVEAVAQADAPTETKVESETIVEPEAKVEEPVTVTSAPEPERPQEPAATGAPPEPEPEVVTAVAAAASAGTTTTENKPEAIAAQASTPASEPTVEPAPETKANEPELAAAWAQWKQIRETVVGSQLTSQIADVAAAELKNTEPASESLSASDEVSPGKPSGNPTAIASIVDSVLAELKPKLVEEIAKKLGDEKGKKK